MNQMQQAIRELSEMDELAVRSSPIHSLHPAAKLIATIVFILVTLSFDKYDLGGLVPMVLWPVLAFISCVLYCPWSWPSACSIRFLIKPSYCGWAAWLFPAESSPC